MAIGNASVTTGKTFLNADDVTTSQLNLLGVPTVALAFTGDTNTGLSNPSADVLGIEAGGSEIIRFSTGGIQAKYGIFRDIDTSVLTLTGGTSGSGANIELYGGTHATLANDVRYDADEHAWRSQNAGTTYMSVASTGLKVGSTGNAIKNIWHTTTTVGLTAVAAGGNDYHGFTVTGAEVGDTVVVNVTDSGFDNVCIEGFVYSPDTVRVMFKNYTSSSRNVAGDLAVMVFDRT